MSINLLNIETTKQYTYSDITNLLKEIKCPVNKFLTEVRKILKLKSSSPLWYGFSDELIKQYSQFKNKDKYAGIEGNYKQTNKGFKYNFRCIPISRSYYIYHCLEININNGIIEVVNAYEESV